MIRENIKKKILLVTLSSLTALSLVACGNETATTNENVTETTTALGLTVTNATTVTTETTTVNVANETTTTEAKVEETTTATEVKVEETTIAPTEQTVQEENNNNQSEVYVAENTEPEVQAPVIETPQEEMVTYYNCDIENYVTIPKSEYDALYNSYIKAVYYTDGTDYTIDWKLTWDKLIPTNEPNAFITEIDSGYGHIVTFNEDNTIARKLHYIGLWRNIPTEELNEYVKRDVEDVRNYK